MNDFKYKVKRSVLYDVFCVGLVANFALQKKRKILKNNSIKTFYPLPITNTTYHLSVSYKHHLPPYHSSVNYKH